MALGERAAQLYLDPNHPLTGVPRALLQHRSTKQWKHNNARKANSTSPDTESIGYILYIKKKVFIGSAEAKTDDGFGSATKGALKKRRSFTKAGWVRRLRSHLAWRGRRGRQGSPVSTSRKANKATQATQRQPSIGELVACEPRYRTLQHCCCLLSATVTAA